MDGPIDKLPGNKVMTTEVESETHTGSLCLRVKEHDRIVVNGDLYIRAIYDYKGKTVLVQLTGSKAKYTILREKLLK